MNDATGHPHQQSLLCNLTPIRPLLIQPQSNVSPDSILLNIPQRKRRRGRRSCNACRQRRMKCDADTILPCSRCKHFGVECHFRNEKGPTNVIQVFEDRVTRLENLLNRTLDQRQSNQTSTLVETPWAPDFSQGDNFPYQNLICGYKGLVPANATLELVEQMNFLHLSDYGTTRYIGSSSGVQLLSPFKISERYRLFLSRPKESKDLECVHG
ncbi:hypothetical protein BJV82DRAFT_157156 [Fennellomyces sp. T-0311]|nr:hypothetical protein BJV82DRAFT_157156 [Fennellomyces sp. T-0311]